MRDELVERAIRGDREAFASLARDSADRCYQAKVAFQDAPANGVAKIYEANLDGSGFHQISTACDCSEEQPAYSPDGTKIAFTRRTGDASSMIAVRDLASGKVTTFPGTEALWPSEAAGDVAEHASWSPDGKVIVYALIHRNADGGLVSSRLLRLDLAGGAVTDVGVPEMLGAGEPRYRPDGSVILFASRSAETSLGEAQGDIYTVHPDGTALTQLTDTGATGASWTPDGRYIIYMSNWIFLMEPDGSNQARWSASGPDLSETPTGYGYTTYWITPAP